VHALEKEIVAGTRRGDAALLAELRGALRREAESYAAHAVARVLDRLGCREPATLHAPLRTAG
jgi:hypothetical protein